MLLRLVLKSYVPPLATLVAETNTSTKYSQLKQNKSPTSLREVYVEKLGILLLSYPVRKKLDSCQKCLSDKIKRTKADKLAYQEQKHFNSFLRDFQICFS